MTGPRRWILGLGLLCVVIGCIYAARSPGTYQDDDVDRFYMARQALREPSLFLHAWGMPVPLLLDAVPARGFGYPGVEFTTVLLTAGAATLAGLAAAAAGLAFPWLAVLFVFFQPMVLNLSYSAMAEPAAAAILALVLWLWYTRRPGAALVAGGWLPLARIDAGLLTLVLLAAGWRRTGRRARILAVAPVALWSGLTFLVTGDPLGILGGEHRPLNSLGPAHYVRNAVVTAGPAVLFCFLWALVAGLRRHRPGAAGGGPAGDAAPEALRTPAPRKGRKTPHQTGKTPDPDPGFPVLALVLAASHLALLSLLAWPSLPFGRSIGFLRHTVASAPALGLVAVWGAGRWLAPRRESLPLRLGFAAAWTAVVALFLSWKLVGDSFYSDQRTEWRWIATALVGLLGIAGGLRPRLSRKILAAFLGAGVCAIALVSVRPIQLDPEREAVENAVEYIRQWDPHAVVYTNHPWFVFLSGRDRYDKVHTPALTREALEKAPPGSFVLWENHYGNRLYGDVPLEVLSGDPRFERMMELEAGATRNFHLVVFRRRS